jgi:hypothetical protein
MKIVVGISAAVVLVAVGGTAWSQYFCGSSYPSSSSWGTVQANAYGTYVPTVTVDETAYNALKARAESAEAKVTAFQRMVDEAPKVTVLRGSSIR